MHPEEEPPRGDWSACAFREGETAECLEKIIVAVMLSRCVAAFRTGMSTRKKGQGAHRASIGTIFVEVFGTAELEFAVAAGEPIGNALPARRVVPAMKQKK